MTEKSADYRAGYVDGVTACLKLMAKWFFMSNKDAKECVNEMQALIAPVLNNPSHPANQYENESKN